jgi:hypothetical protein
MQFNFVISTNVSAVRLWQKLGFKIVGTLPGAFHHPEKGEIDVYVMYRSLLADGLSAVARNKHCKGDDFLLILVDADGDPNHHDRAWIAPGKDHDRSSTSAV